MGFNSGFKGLKGQQGFHLARETEGGQHHTFSSTFSSNDISTFMWSSSISSYVVLSLCM